MLLVGRAPGLICGATRAKAASGPALLVAASMPMHIQEAEIHLCRLFFLPMSTIDYPREICPLQPVNAWTLRALAHRRLIFCGGCEHSIRQVGTCDVIS